MAGQTPFSKVFPETPKDYQSPWYYASLQSFWLYYLVDPDVLRSRLATLPAASELDVARFDVGNEKSALVSLDLQRYTGQGPTFLESTSEVEFNIYVYPKVREPDVPRITLDHYLLGWEQTKTIGGYRLHVPCDDINAVNAGKGLYGEPKYLAYFDYDVPSVNGPPYPPGTRWRYDVYQDVGNASPPVQGPLVFGIDCDLAGAPSAPANQSPLIEYGAVEDQTGTPRLVANFWDFSGPLDTCPHGRSRPAVAGDPDARAGPGPAGSDCRLEAADRRLAALCSSGVHVEPRLGGEPRLLPDPQ